MYVGYKDPDRQRTYQRDWARQQRDARNRQMRIRRAEFTAWVQSLKTSPCTDCGGCFHPAAMHWDHLPGSVKHGSIRELMRFLDKDRILAEIVKCELVCANCHAIRTYDRIERLPESHRYESIL